MTFPNVFTKEVSDQLINRLNQLTPESQPQWGKMNIGQMLAHCCVAYETVYTDKHPRPNAVMRYIVRLLALDTVTGPKPYPKNGRTAPHFIISDERDFEVEKARLIEFIQKTQQLGESHFDGKESHSMGKFTLEQWNSLFYKHLDHHLNQFGV